MSNAHFEPKNAKLLDSSLRALWANECVKKYGVHELK